MLFEALYEALQKGELLLVEGGFCHFHVRRDRQLTIREILSSKPGVGQRMLAMLKTVPGITCIVAKCPADLPSNDWYGRRGFVLVNSEKTKTGRTVNTWRLEVAAVQVE